MNDPASIPNSHSLAYVEQLYAEYLRNPAAVPPASRSIRISSGPSRPKENPRSVSSS